ncbi:MAG: hypothetical protein U0163_19320 [Gemmatimonadaceae bacterium]
MRGGCALAATHAQAQGNPLAPIRVRGQSVTPAFEGWYKNPDGTYSLSFGYFNRNSEEVVDIPIGPENSFTPGPADRGQPTHFHPRRHWGVFTVVVPADTREDQKFVWTLISRSDTTQIPGSLKQGWQIDALSGEAGSGNTPPQLRFEPSGATGAGPGGLMGPPLAAKVGTPLTLDVWATDDGRTPSGHNDQPPTLMWFVHQGPSGATFQPAAPLVDKATGKATTTATFPVAGSYLLRVRVNDASGVVAAGHAQCCWTNGFVKVTVTP